MMVLRKRVCALVLALCAVAFLVPGSIAAQSGRSQGREGNRLYGEGRFDEAHRKYLEALAENPESPLLRFNDGNALYRSEDYQSALQAYLEALEQADPSIAGSAWYNVGNTLFRQQQLEQSLEAYKEALRTNPGDQDAKHNLERVLQLMQEQQDQDQQDQDQNQEAGQQDEEDPQQGDQDQEDEQEQDPPEEQQEQEGEPETPDEQQGDPEDQQDEPEANEGQPPPAPGQMTAEEAERLLEAIQEDPGDVNRKRAPVRGPRPRKPW